MKYTMTKQEALESMKAGNKVTHLYFSDCEYIYIKHNVITSEDGYNFEEWWRDVEPTFGNPKEKEWAIFIEKEGK